MAIYGRKLDPSYMEVNTNTGIVYYRNLFNQETAVWNIVPTSTGIIPDLGYLGNNSYSTDYSFDAENVTLDLFIENGWGSDVESISTSISNFLAANFSLWAADTNDLNFVVSVGATHVVAFAYLGSKGDEAPVINLSVVQEVNVTNPMNNVIDISHDNPSPNSLYEHRIYQNNVLERTNDYTASGPTASTQWYVFGGENYKVAVVPYLNTSPRTYGTATESSTTSILAGPVDTPTMVNAVYYTNGNPAEDFIEVSWTGFYIDQITAFEIYRDSTLIATLPGDARFYNDVTDFLSPHDYSVVALVGAASSMPGSTQYFPM